MNATDGRVSTVRRAGIAVLCGFLIGALAASAYLLLGGDYLFIPRWAYILFYPGFLAGNTAYDLGLRQDPSKVVGVLAVGLAYALLALLLRFAWSTARKRMAKGPPDRTISPSSRSALLALLWLFVAASAQAENPFAVPDHVWVLGLDSHQPVGIAWDNPVWAGVHSSIQMYLCFGMQHPFELELPVVVLGLLLLGGFVALVFGLARRFIHCLSNLQAVDRLPHTKPPKPT